MARPSFRKTLRRARKLAGVGSFPIIAMLAGAGCPVDAYGPQPAYGIQDECDEPPVACIDDQECIDDNGEGWYCDEQALWDDGCDIYEHPQCVDGNE